MNNPHSRLFYPQSRFSNQTSNTSPNQHPARLTNTRLNYQPAFNQNVQSPSYARVPNASNMNLQPPSPYLPPRSSFNTPHPVQNQLKNASSSQQNFSQPQSRVYGELYTKQPQNVQSLNSSSANVSNSSSYGTTSSFPPKHVDYPSLAQPITGDTSFPAKESSRFQGPSTLVPPPNLNIARPPNMPPHLLNHQTMMSNSYNLNFAMPIPPPGMSPMPHGMPPTLPGMPSIQPGMPPTSPGMSSIQPGMPPTPPGMSSIQPGMPPTQPGMSLTPSVIPVVQNLPSQIIGKSSAQVNQSLPVVFPPFVPQGLPFQFSQTESYMPPALTAPVSEKERMLLSFIERFPLKEKKKLENPTVAQFRTSLKQGLHLVKKLMLCKENLTQMLQSDEKEWVLEVNKVLHYQNLLAQTCSVLTMPKILNSVRKKLEAIKKKRSSKKKMKQNALNERVKKMKEREQLNQEIDKWLDSIKEKNLKLKRETEMKKEADSILSEVRRKIQEAKRTIEKIKVFEKLRNTRQSNAAKKGLFLPEHDERFKNSVSNLKETVYRQLSHYESEEKALKVMLEAEQEGQLEEEAKWKVKRMRTLQEKRQKNIIECLFGDTTEEPEEDEPIYLFYQFQNSANKSIENLVQIRHQWDVHINENGEPVPHQWVVPVPPSSSGWEVALNS